MIYKPQTGKMKDNCMYYHNGTFYHFSMYSKVLGSNEYNNVFLSISHDGVHFEDYGCVVDNFPKRVWAMKVYRGNDAFYMNSGSFTEDERQAVLKFWRSEDLKHWEYKPELDLLAPSDGDVRLDCMNVVHYNGTYYGYSTGDYMFWTSKDGISWELAKGVIEETAPIPQNEKHFEIADCVEIDGEFFLFSGAFGHLGQSGYGVYVYKSSSPLGPFRPNFPYYRINGTSLRWVNMWERCFWKDDELLAHNYMYDGYSYECGNSYLPPIKKVEKHGNGLRLRWWDGNKALIGKPLQKASYLQANVKMTDVFTPPKTHIQASNLAIDLPQKAVVECQFSYQPRNFTEFPKGGVLLSENDGYATAISFDCMGKCEILRVHNGEIEAVEDVIGFSSSAPFWLQGGKEYTLRILINNGMFEVYVDDLYLQTFNNAHFFPKNSPSPFTTESGITPFKTFSAFSINGNVEVRNVTVFEMNL